MLLLLRNKGLVAQLPGTPEKDTNSDHWLGHPSCAQVGRKVLDASCTMIPRQRGAVKLLGRVTGRWLLYVIVG